MDALELSYENMEAVPKEYVDLYVETDGKAVFTHLNGMKTQGDIDKLSEALRKERGDHTTSKEALKIWGDLKFEDVRKDLDRIPELEAVGGGKIDEVKMEELVGARLTQKTAPLERTILDKDTLIGTLQDDNKTLKSSIERRDLHGEIRTIGTEMKILPTAMPDAEMLAGAYFERDPDTNKFITKADVVGVEAGLDVKQFMKSMQTTRPHWWPNSAGGGAGGGGPAALDGKDNPWANATWNMTSQGKIVVEHGMEVSERLAKAAGTTVGGLKPSK